MADHTITLNAVQELIVSVMLERRNAQRAENDDAPFTIDQLLHALIAEKFEGIRNHLNEITQEPFETLPKVTATQRNAYLAQMPDGPKKSWLIGRLT